MRKSVLGAILPSFHSTNYTVSPIPTHHDVMLIVLLLAREDVRAGVGLRRAAPPPPEGGQQALPIHVGVLGGLLGRQQALFGRVRVLLARRAAVSAVIGGPSLAVAAVAAIALGEAVDVELLASVVRGRVAPGGRDRAQAAGAHHHRLAAEEEAALIRRTMMSDASAMEKMRGVRGSWV